MGDERVTLFSIGGLLLLPWALTIAGVAWTSLKCLVLDWDFHRYSYRFQDTFGPDFNPTFMAAASGFLVGAIALGAAIRGNR